MARAKQDSKMKTEQANQLKALEQAGAEKRMEVKRKLQEVRKVCLTRINLCDNGVANFPICLI